jgi:hypothetical protein
MATNPPIDPELQAAIERAKQTGQVPPEPSPEWSHTLTGLINPIYALPEQGSLAREKWDAERKRTMDIRNAVYNELEQKALAAGQTAFPWEGGQARTRSQAELQRVGVLPSAETKPITPTPPAAPPAPPVTKPEGTTEPAKARVPQVVVRQDDGSFTLVDPSDPRASSDSQRMAGIAEWKQKALTQQEAADKVPPTFDGIAPGPGSWGQTGGMKVQKGPGAFSGSWNLGNAAIVNDASKPQEISYGIDIAKAVSDPNYATKIRQQLSPLQKDLFEEEVNKTRADTQAATAQRLQEITANAAAEKFKEESDPAYAFQKATATYAQFRQQALLAMKNPRDPMRQKFDAFMELKTKELDADSKLTPQQRRKALELFALGLEDQLIQQAMSMQKMTEKTVTPESLQAASVAQARGGMFPGMMGGLPATSGTP